MPLPVRSWIERYAPAEAAGLVLALVASSVVRHLTHSAIFAGYAAAWGESIGYASVIVTRDFSGVIRESRRVGHKTVMHHAVHVATNLLAEFGPAGVMDTFITRPFAMAIGMKWLGPVYGLLAGKVTADLLFYIPVLYVHHYQKVHQRNGAKLPL